MSNLEQELGREAVAQWVRPLKVSRFDAANLYLEVADPMAASWFEEYVRPRIKAKFYNENHRPIRVHLEQKGQEKAKPSYTPEPPKIQPDSIEPFATLSNFVVHPGNEIACKLFSQWNGVLFNPIYLFGPKGSGKTHLLMAAALKFSQAGKKVFYVKADTFTEHVVQAIRSGSMQEFRKIYREIDFLLVDDVEKLAGRAATQEEFFHTFNTLHTSGKQIVLASRLAPSKIEEIEPRLISRFEWGIALAIDPAPIPEILQLKARLWNLPLTPEFLTFLLNEFRSDPIQALQILALRAPPGQPIAIAAAEKLLADLKKKEDPLTPEQIIKAISGHFGITPEDLIGKSQTREFAVPRQIAMYACRTSLNLPFQAIGKLFGRDHSTVMSSVKLIEKGLLEKNQDWIEALSSIRKG